MIRQPIVILVGHIDHGKSSILEKIKGISITKGEAGGITQCIKCYTVPLETIKKVCGNLLTALKLNISIPGLLFLDSPGHAAFNNMRKRGGNLADIAIFVIDVAQGIQEQTKECIAILKEYKTPFVIALNKIDSISGWRSDASAQLLRSIKAQSGAVQALLDRKLYELVGELSTFGLNAERFDRVEDYTKQVAVIPLSAKTGEGVPELLMVITGLAQRYLEKELEIEAAGPGKATVLEVNEIKGTGLTLDVILFDGALKVNDQVVIGTLDEPIVTKVRALFEADGKKLKPVKEVTAAAGVKLVAPNIEGVIGGMPLVAANDDVESARCAVMAEVRDVLVVMDKEGVTAKADTLGSLEALMHLLRNAGVKIKRASIGDVNKRDLADAVTEKNPVYRAILGFNVKATNEEGVKVIAHPVIYKIVEDYQEWQQRLQKVLEQEELENVTYPCKLKILRGCIFRQSNPAVVGVHVLAGKLKTEIKLMRQDGMNTSHVKSIQEEGKSISEAAQGKEVAISIPNIIVGRHIKEDDILYSDLTSGEFVKLKQMKKILKDDEIDVLKEIAAIKRKSNPVWGI